MNLLEVRLAVPDIQQHHHLLLIHAKAVRIPDDIFIEELEEADVTEVSEFDMDNLRLLLSHIGPQISLSAKSFLGAFDRQSLKKLVAAKHVSLHAKPHLV